MTRLFFAQKYLVANPHYGEYSFKYVDAGTMYLDLDANDADIYRGLFIKVNILRHRLATKEMRNYSQALENMCEGKAVDRGRIGTLISRSDLCRLGLSVLRYWSFTPTAAGDIF